MSMPPTNISASDLFAKLSQATRPYTIVDFPRYDAEGNTIFPIAIQLVSQADSMLIAAEAEKKARKMMQGNIPNKGEVSKGYDDVFNNASAIELLFRACRDPEDLTKPLFPSKEAIGNVCLNDEIGILLNHYFTLSLELGPIVGYMQDGELDAWVERLAEGGSSSSQYFLNSLSWEAMKNLLISMASRLSKVATPNGFVGTPPENTPSIDQKD